MMCGKLVKGEGGLRKGPCILECISACEQLYRFRSECCKSHPGHLYDKLTIFSST